MKIGKETVPRTRISTSDENASSASPKRSNALSCQATRERVYEGEVPEGFVGKEKK